MSSIDIGGLEPYSPYYQDNNPITGISHSVEENEPFPTISQKRAVEKAQNANRRGRGRKIEGRVQIHFDANSDLAGMIEDIHFERGVTKTALYNEALLLLVEKYHNIKPANNEK